MRLSKEQLQYGFYYYFKGRKDGVGHAVELSDYSSGEKLSINCTQLGSKYKSQKDKSRVVDEWCEFLVAQPKAFKGLSFGTRMPQKLFEAVCHQERLENLEIKWGAYDNLSAIEKLQKLKLLSLGSGASVRSVRPISTLPVLAGLKMENFQKATDYSSLADLRSLQSLTIEGDFFGPRFTSVDSLEFLREMQQLRFLTLLTIRLQSKDYSPILDLKGLVHLSVAPCREVKELYDSMRRLPKLKWGMIKEQPELYTTHR